MENLITARTSRRRTRTTTRTTFVAIGDPFPGPKNEQELLTNTYMFVWRID